MSTIAQPPPVAERQPPRRRAATSPRARGVALVALGLAGLVCEAWSLWPVVAGEGDVTFAEVVFRAAGGSFVAAGLIAWHRRPANRTGKLMVVTGLLFFIQPITFQFDSAWVVTLGTLATDYWSVPFVTLLLAFPTGRALSTAERLLVGAVAVPLVLLQPVWLAFLEEPGVVNELVVWPNEGVATVVDKAQRGLLLPCTLALFLILARRWLRASRPLRRVLLPALAGGATMLSFGAMLALDLINGTRSQALFTVTVVALATVPLASAIGLLRSRLARVAVGGLLLELRGNPPPSAVRDAIGRALGDPSVELAYWLPEFGAYADVDGRRVELPSGDDGRATTLIDRDDDTHVAALLHDPSLRDEAELLDAVTAAAGIALENGRLHAELRAQLEELRGSRARIVEAGQSERQRLERNLHDGAQQRLVALSLELGLLEGHVAGDPEARARLGRAREEIASSLAELRELARGLHPAVVSAHGLEVALEQLAARAPVPVRLRIETGGRLPEALEVAAFYLVSESLANVAKYAGASSVAVDVVRADAAVVVEVRDDGCGGADPDRGSGLRGLADRVEALDGRLRVWSPVGGGTRVRAELPCAS